MQLRNYYIYSAKHSCSPILSQMKPLKTIPTSVLHIHDAADAVTLLHVLEGLVDILERLAVGDELIHL